MSPYLYTFSNKFKIEEIFCAQLVLIWWQQKILFFFNYLKNKKKQKKKNKNKKNKKKKKNNNKHKNSDISTVYSVLSFISLIAYQLSLII